MLFQTSDSLTPDSLALPQAPQASDSVAAAATTFGERLNNSFALLGDFVPALAGALTILFVGYLLAKVVEKGTQRLLRRLHFNQLLERGGVMQAVERSGSHLNPAKVIANLLFWFVMFAVLLVAANAIGMESLANVFSELVSYIPSVIAAIVIIILGIVLGGFVGGLIMASAGGLHGGPWLARIGRGGVIVLAIFMALQELGIATDIVTTAFAILFGAVALALALSFGLGNRDLAGEVTRDWYNRYRAERLAIEAEAAAEEAEELAEEEAEERAEEAELTAVRRIAPLLLLAVALPFFVVRATAQGTPVRKPAATPAKTPASAGNAAEARAEARARAGLAADEKEAADKVARLRALYLRGASWADLGTRCNPGDLRVFAADTTPHQRDSVQKIAELMERTVVSRGVGGSLAGAGVGSLLRTIVGWEAGIDRPHWDSDEPQVRTAFATGLTGETPDPRSDKCLPSPIARDTVTFVIPGVADMPFPGATKPRVKAYFGPQAIAHARDEFFAERGKADPESELQYTLVAPIVTWRDWAVVRITRPRERQGIAIGQESDGGATYLMRQSGKEWRLLAVLRTWGS